MYVEVSFLYVMLSWGVGANDQDSKTRSLEILTFKKSKQDR